MYTTDSINVPMGNAKTEETPTLTQMISRDLSDINDRQTRVINAIEDRLHEIINMRSNPVVDGAGKKEEISINDFRSDMGVKISILKENTLRIENILDHLGAI
jgi:hypothetical protein